MSTTQHSAQATCNLLVIGQWEMQGSALASKTKPPGNCPYQEKQSTILVKQSHIVLKPPPLTTTALTLDLPIIPQLIVNF